MSEKQKAVARERMKRRWADPAFREKMRTMPRDWLPELNRSAQKREIQRKRMAEMNATPEIAAKRAAGAKAHNENPAVIAAVKEALAARNRDPEFQIKRDAGRRHPRLPPMSTEEKRQYRKFRFAGVDRITALRATFDARYVGSGVYQQEAGGAA